ncbi:MAG: sulfite exporter TauE/SafE family protein [Methylotenera sp.]
MLLDTQWILSFLLLGSFVGFMAGLFGIGGGGIMVPVLTTLFIYQGVPVEKVVHLALGTSMASIIVTSLSSMRAHYAKDAILWPIVKVMALGIILGTFITTFIVVNIPSIYLALFFSLFMAYVSMQMFLDKKPKPSRMLAGNGGLLLAGSGIGAISALVSIGGGSLTVPYLLWQNVDIKNAIGTSAALGFPISVVGTIGYMVNGWAATTVEAYTFGFVYIPAVLLISATSVITAPYGAQHAHNLPVKTLKKLFALLLIALSLKMLFSIL